MRFVYDHKPESFPIVRTSVKHGLDGGDSHAALETWLLRTHEDVGSHIFGQVRPQRGFQLGYQGQGRRNEENFIPRSVIDPLFDNSSGDSGLAQASCHQQ